MIRELFIQIYLTFFRIFFILSKQFDLKKRSVFVTSFGDNVSFVVPKLLESTNETIIILQTNSCKGIFPKDSRVKLVYFEVKQPLHWIKGIYYLATSQTIFVDNYFGFLDVTSFKKSVRCIQLWHAAGAIKQFGLKDPSIASRSNKAQERFHKVYNRFTHIVVGSTKMATIFKECFGATDEAMIYSGVPRTDFFFNPEAMDKVKVQLHEHYPQIRNKKVLLYAPTFRDNALSVQQLELDIRLLEEKLCQDYVLLLKLHPAVTGNLNIKNSSFVLDMSRESNINHLLVITDILITDYSSIPFEFALLNRPMIFFAYDLEQYTKLRGFTEPYEQLAPGPIISSTEELISTIENHSFDLNNIQAFSEMWNTFSTGHASETLVSILFNEQFEKTPLR